MTSKIHTQLAKRALLPAKHLLDNGYMSADNLVAGQKQGVDLIGPVWQDPIGQA